MITKEIVYCTFNDYLQLEQTKAGLVLGHDVVYTKMLHTS